MVHIKKKTKKKTTLKKKVQFGDIVTQQELANTHSPPLPASMESKQMGSFSAVYPSARH